METFKTALWVRVLENGQIHSLCLFHLLRIFTTSAKLIDESIILLGKLLRKETALERLER